jgi:hypothetical protein
MKKLFFTIFSAVCLLGFVGCLDITEELTVNKDGSGHYVSTIDALKMSEQMTMFAAMDTTGEMIPKMKYTMDSSFLATTQLTKDIKGITNIKLDTSKSFVYIISYDFKDIESLNKALGAGKTADSQNTFAWEKGKITRKEVPLSLGMGDMNLQDDSQKEMMKGFMADMKYKVIYNLPGKVKNASNKSFVLSEDKKVLKLDTNFGEIMEGKIKLGGEVSYK